MTIDMDEVREILKRMNACVKDEHGQPLVCYGCAHSAAYCEWSGTKKVVEGTDFPGMPSGERPCHFCIRNAKREEGIQIDKWYDQSEPLKVPMDCYYSIDMHTQIADWEEEQDDKVPVKCVFFLRDGFCTKNNNPEEPGECIYKGGIITDKAMIHCSEGQMRLEKREK
jgi:hypothetical protein